MHRIDGPSICLKLSKDFVASFHPVDHVSGMPDRPDTSPSAADQLKESVPDLTKLLQKDTDCEPAGLAASQESVDDAATQNEDDSGDITENTEMAVIPTSTAGTCYGYML